MVINLHRVLDLKMIGNQEFWIGIERSLDCVTLQDMYNVLNPSEQGSKKQRPSSMHSPIQNKHLQRTDKELFSLQAIKVNEETKTRDYISKEREKNHRKK
mmetsp:Transcript_26059/g.39864  ORF Transcript_26059/g.39864 Transcript_26059/m.39864 type:complete len:100 (+) Transcript_26059:39-338(+)